MVSSLVCIAVVGLSIQAFIGLSFFLSCVWEKETRATLVALVQLIVMTGLLGGFIALAKTGAFHTSGGIAFLIIGYAGAIAASAFFLKKSGANPNALEGTNGLITGEVTPYDERQIVFARNRSLRPGSKEFELFYQAHPEYREFDDKRRAMGGPLGRMGTVDKPHADINTAMMLASLSIPSYLGDPLKISPERHPALAAALGSQKIRITPEEASLRIKGYAKRLGASLVGITKLNPLWIYSNRGEIFRENWEDWGREIKLDHTYVIVFAEEMDLELVGTAPHTPTSIESMYNYARGAFIASQLASLIANLGYGASANHLRHYDGLMVPMAVDAGLGELSRMGYLITKELGPRVRLSAVTTDLTLVPDQPVDIGVKDFCNVCKKCSVCCPSSSIPDGKPEEINGTIRWQMNAQTCFEYWGRVGTDCNRCMMVCPWSHARTFPHRLIVFLITRNKWARRIFSFLDDLFYGRQPRPKKGPDWTAYN